MNVSYTTPPRWRPHCAILPNGIVFPLEGLSTVSIDDGPFSVLFGEASMVSRSVRTQILAAYMAAAGDTTRAIYSAMHKGEK